MKKFPSHHLISKIGANYWRPKNLFFTDFNLFPGLYEVSRECYKIRIFAAATSGRLRSPMSYYEYLGLKYN